MRKGRKGCFPVVRGFYFASRIYFCNNFYDIHLFSCIFQYRVLLSHKFLNDRCSTRWRFRGIQFFFFNLRHVFIRKLFRRVKNENQGKKRRILRCSPICYFFDANSIRKLIISMTSNPQLQKPEAASLYQK